MNFDDVVYLSLLISSIFFGYYYRQISDVTKRKNVGTLVGLVIVLIVSGLHIIHIFNTVIINSAIILFIDKRKCHLVSFVFSFLYLFFFRTTVYFGIPYPPSHTNLVQMMLTLKLVGLAFEVNTAYLSKKKRDESVKTEEQRLADKSADVHLSFIDIFHYSFNYIGVLTGPYYRYRTFKDYFESPYSKHVNWKQSTIDKLKYVPIYCVLFVTATYFWPFSYAKSDEFYNERSWLYRYWYIWPTFFIFRMRIYIGLVLSECVCTVAGLGAYPTLMSPKAGEGPTENFTKIEELVHNEGELEKLDYNFETIHNIDTYGAEFCTLYRDAMKYWNICIQYWLAVNIYKRFPNKKMRTTATVMVSAVWHGVYTGYYVCIGTVPLVLAVEDVWVKVLMKDKKASLLIEWVMYILRLHFFSYQAIAFHLLQLNLIWYYYNSIYHAGFILGAILYVIGLQLLKTKKAEERNKSKAEGSNKEPEMKKVQ